MTIRHLYAAAHIITAAYVAAIIFGLIEPGRLAMTIMAAWVITVGITAAVVETEKQ